MIDWSDPGFALLCEIEPATRPDLHHVRRQIAASETVEWRRQLDYDGT